MTKILNGRDLADFIKERQAHQVRGLIQHDHVRPKLAIIQTIDNPVIDTYVRLKKAYGADILIDVDVHKIPQSEAIALVARLNQDDTVHGIIIQLPLENPEETSQIVDAVDPAKDVDGLGAGAILDPATPMAINWLLAGYNVELRGKNIVIVGNGRLVGAPLARMWRNSNLAVTVLDSSSNDPEQIKDADVIVAATGVPGLIKSDDVKTGAVVIDAGTASEQGKIVGDVDPELRDRSDITITPEKGGVGPLTITALFDNVIRAARSTVKD
ncbi:MAG TPA: bifunctional 5,10-methylenetetrahydrofolate dehydrogenase/5,10-methenyltetrahydrofolate cyclohydrolase [Candidatus Nanoperiomorbaceae bacterium]|nr:MAG: bifunctional 5,10-methylenetetrahydrofolate dehydrogenase/5,10-methenyltetrahydrofolate cyclohydrolase [Candidatus Saccharibacteria bacterium]HMQ09157.1 bifunctional 5,10-methylenetetrahydrofolate dehydrogenase/5,10-methenyltetrahydrofolate cyclohydrolase [Candidatus Nanoperiomorbaceae bacterium]HMQ96670.1 bifunctional 5,10-methylenetetrahydrofolate dehydrogenase/5,10-methenyltetrahydrofolate cyclohydrolase [Candidatus Nanoperiomorbaceae bacterium]HMU12107.1 bifunctional 5,10-methylenete